MDTMDHDDLFSLDPSPSTPGSDVPQLTISPADTSLSASPEPKAEDSKTEEKKPVKKRKSWGQELPVPKTNLPPRKRAKTEDEKEQRRIERVLRNRAAAQTSRERKRLEVEKLEGEKQRMEQQNQFLLQRLAQIEAENSRLNRQVAQLSAEIRGSRSNSPKAVPSSAASPTLTPTLFKQEGDDVSLDRIPFPTPSITDYPPSLKPSDLAEAADLTQHPAAMLCDLQCQSAASKAPQARSLSSTADPAFQRTLYVIMQLLFLTMTSAAYSTVIHPLSRILRSLKTGSPLTFSPEEISRHFPLILWLISTPSLSASPAQTRRSVFRKKLLTRLLACSPALARPLRDATGKTLQLAVRERFAGQAWSPVGDRSGRPDWELLLTMAFAIDCIGKSSKFKRRSRDIERAKRSGHSGYEDYHGSTRSSWGLNGGQTLTSLLMGKPC
ncbi:transcriptional regulator family: bZIP [Paecilomyces variotii]|nr:transcriptional regulator family: bZIP [Paecilomyces variotii]KAJ9203801.1 transcriptional regulator family: bZIP [Paecilomyces variotii]KAJ9213274.1 transcriptional regulator family: bZIP [Paecilomyces variotii]KAJ9230878.1 transcriptional regulator family: bZIP [Paecilomyces variotii]KAJ9262556.1 transcriptional regulator family: bZIP [Paecilomyces variotii]